MGIAAAFAKNKTFAQALPTWHCSTAIQVAKWALRPTNTANDGPLAHLIVCPANAR